MIRHTLRGASIRYAPYIVKTFSERGENSKTAYRPPTSTGLNHWLHERFEKGAVPCLHAGACPVNI
jgi:hypothetical protein